MRRYHKAWWNIFGMPTLLLTLGLFYGMNAQINTGIILGTVTDPTGAVVPNAEVTLIHLERRTSVKVVTDATGAYHRYGSATRAV
ncbi:MAG: carboxypeptidase-like regulatory domain-containing protein [Acidobacteriota bacterium]|nr:carboxypeptidase-like regulatory domain-containing protein [Acidobacteriota bacterium]